MTRLLLITLLLLISSPAYAGWVRIDKTDIDKTDDGMTTYVDPDTIRRKGNLVKIWELFDFKTIQTSQGNLLSRKSQDEYDCAEERRRTLAFMDFSGNMGSGRVVDRNVDEGKWEPIAPDSVGQVLWKLVCGKK